MSDLTVQLKPSMGPAAGPAAIRDDIQGLRAIAVGMVVAFHAGVTSLSGGYVGVDVFFVISGYLITSHLIRSIELNGRIDFGAFYARRARRILPAAFLVLIVSVVCAWIWMPPLQHDKTFQAAAATALYVPNILFASQYSDYLAEKVPSVFQQYWSLGVEEQFYLCWPVVLVVLYRMLRRYRQKGVLTALVMVAASSFALCIYLTEHSQPLAFFLLPARAWELATGALVAMLIRSGHSWLRHRSNGLLGSLGLGLIVLSAVTFSSATAFPGPAAAVPVLGTALVIFGGSWQSTLAPSRLLSVRPLRLIGALSYSLYLVHWPMLIIPQAAAGWVDPLSAPVKLSLAAASVPLAYLCYRYVELPFQRSRFLTEARPRRSLLLSAATSLIIVVLCAGGIAMSALEPSDSGNRANEYSLTVAPHATRFVPTNLAPDLRHAQDDNPEIYANGCHHYYWSPSAAACIVGHNERAPRIVLFGDSHAAEWYPALSEMARSGTVRLEIETMSECGSVPSATDYAECVAWRREVDQRLNDDPPAVVLLGNFTGRRSDAMGDPGQFWETALTNTVHALPATSKVVVLADTPFMTVTPAICLSAHLYNTTACDVARDRALNAGFRAAEERITASGAVGYIDLTDYFCNDVSCPAIIGNALVYRDADHVTRTFIQALTPVISSALTDIMRPSS